MKNVEISYNTKGQLMVINLPCLPYNEEDNPDETDKYSQEKKSKECASSLDLWKLKKITDQCYIRVDNSTELIKPECNFDYGFASKFRGTIRAFEVFINFLLNYLRDFFII